MSKIYSWRHKLALAFSMKVNEWLGVAFATQKCWLEMFNILLFSNRRKDAFSWHSKIVYEIDDILLDIL